MLASVMFLWILAEDGTDYPRRTSDDQVLVVRLSQRCWVAQASVAPTAVDIDADGADPVSPSRQRLLRPLCIVAQAPARTLRPGCRILQR